MTYRYTARTLLSLLATSLVLLGATPAATQPVAPQRTELGALVLDGVPAHSARVTRTLDTWLAGRSAGFQDFLADGSVLILGGVGVSNDEGDTPFCPGTLRTVERLAAAR